MKYDYKKETAKYNLHIIVCFCINPPQFLCTVAQVPYLPSSKVQTLNIMKLLEGRAGRLVDLGSGDGRVVSALLVSIPRN